MDDKLKKYRYDTDKAEKFFTKMMAYTLGPMELKEMMKDEHVKILDVRDYTDYFKDHIPNAISMPRTQIDSRIE